MLDTVKLRIPRSNYRLLKADRFRLVASPSNSNGVIVCRTYANNATSAEKKALVYRPRLTLIKQLGREEYLKLEVSAQTVLLGNTLQEVSEDDFERDLKALKKSLFEMGVATDISSLKCAEVMDSSIKEYTYNWRLFRAGHYKGFLKNNSH